MRITVINFKKDLITMFLSYLNLKKPSITINELYALSN